MWMMMKRKIMLVRFFVVLLLLAAVFLGAQEKSFIWEIQVGAGKSYLLGSVHFLKKDMYPLKPAMEDAFAAADVLAVEVDVSADKIMAAALLTMKRGMYTGEDTLKENISEKTYKLVEEWLKKNNMNIKDFKKHKPWLLAMTITGMELMKLGFDPNYGIDKYFMDKAAGKKEILELEGVEFQLDLFEGFSREENDQFLFAALQDAATSKEEFDKMVAAWLKGDAAEMEKLFTKNIRKYPELKGIFEKLNDARNEKMAAKILSFLNEEKTYLIVVGAAHLLGNKGLIQLLRDKGYTLKQL